MDLAKIVSSKFLTNMQYPEEIQHSMTLSNKGQSEWMKLKKQSMLVCGGETFCWPVTTECLRHHHISCVQPISFLFSLFPFQHNSHLWLLSLPGCLTD